MMYNKIISCISFILCLLLFVGCTGSNISKDGNDSKPDKGVYNKIISDIIESTRDKVKKQVESNTTTTVVTTTKNQNPVKIEKPKPKPETTPKPAPNLHKDPEIEKILSRKVNIDYVRQFNLSNDELIVYRQFVNAIQNNIEEVVLEKQISYSDFQIVFSCFLDTSFENSNAFNLASVFKTSQNKVVKVVFEYTKYNKEENEKRNKQLNDVVSSLVKQINKKETEFDKILFIHDYLINTCKYSLKDIKGDENINKSIFTAYGALIEKEAVCSGYSKAFSLLCYKSGIQSMIVTGKSKGENPQNHMWNMVKCDGEWYHIDVTWDDSLQIKTNENRYEYFNVDTKTIEKDHVIDKLYFSPPVTEATKANYFIKNNLFVNEYKQFKDIVSNKIGGSKEGNYTIFVKCSSSIVYSQCLHNFFNEPEREVYDVIKQINENIKKDGLIAEAKSFNSYSATNVIIINYEIKTI